MVRSIYRFELEPHRHIEHNSNSHIGYVKAYIIYPQDAVHVPML